MEMPPVLAQFPEAPVYELHQIVEKVGVRPITLWAWEQQLGIASGDRPEVNPTNQKRRYSERDLVALLWLRAQIMAGESPQEASARLLAAQRASGAPGMLGPMTAYGGTEALASASGTSGSLNMSGPLGSSQAGFQGAPSGRLAPFGPSRAPGSTDASAGLPSLGSGAIPGSLGSGEATPFGTFDTPPAPWPAALTGSLGSRVTASPTTSGALASGALGTGQTEWQGGVDHQRDQWTPEPWASRPDAAQPPLTNMPAPTLPNSAIGARQSGPLGGGSQYYAGSPVQTGGHSGRLVPVFGQSRLPASSLATRGYGQPMPDPREARPLVTPLLQAFARFDTRRADTTILEALGTWGVEATILGLVHPAITRISDLWSKSELTAPEEQFGLNYLRGLLFSIYHSTAEVDNAPFAVIACAPKEMNDFGALTLAVFWRRANLRVIYLGQDVNEEDLLQERWPVTPAVVVLTASSSQRIRAMARIGKKLRDLPAPQPIFAYTGSVFARNTELQRKLGGVYLGDDAATATKYIRQVLHLDW